MGTGASSATAEVRWAAVGGVYFCVGRLAMPLSSKEFLLAPRPPATPLFGVDRTLGRLPPPVAAVWLAMADLSNAVSRSFASGKADPLELV